MENIDVLQNLFDTKIIRIINEFLQDRQKQFYLREIAKETGVPVTTTHRILQKLEQLKIIKTIKISRFKLYQIEENDQVMFLASIIKARKKALQEFIDEVIILEGINIVILHGEETETKANILLIGKGIDADKVKDLVSKTKENHDFTVTYMSLTSAQYEQMSSMGLLPRQKKILFER